MPTCAATSPATRSADRNDASQTTNTPSGKCADEAVAKSVVDEIVAAGGEALVDANDVSTEPGCAAVFGDARVGDGLRR